MYTGQITSREYTAGLNAEHSVDWKQFAEMFNPEVRGTTLYLMLTFSACGFVYYGFSFIYPHTLEQLYGVSLEEAFGQLLIVSGVEIGCCIVFTFYMDFELVGRRGAMLTAWTLTCVCSLIALGVKDNQQAFQIANLLLKGCSGAAFTVIYVYAGELLPSTVRASVISVGGCFGRIATMGAPTILTALLEDNVDWVYYFYIGISGMAVLVGLLQYRETLGDPLVIYSSDLKPELERLQSLSWVDRYFPIVGQLRKGTAKEIPYTPLG